MKNNDHYVDELKPTALVFVSDSVSEEGLVTKISSKFARCDFGDVIRRDSIETPVLTPEEVERDVVGDAGNQLLYEFDPLWVGSVKANFRQREAFHQLPSGQLFEHMSVVIVRQTNSTELAKAFYELAPHLLHLLSLPVQGLSVFPFPTAGAIKRLNENDSKHKVDVSDFDYTSPYRIALAITKLNSCSSATHDISLGCASGHFNCDHVEFDEECYLGVHQTYYHTTDVHLKKNNFFCR